MIPPDFLPVRWATQTTPPALLRRMTGHAGAVQAVAFLPDNRRALSAAEDGTLILWELATGTALRAFTGHTGPVTAVVLSSDGRTAFSGAADGEIHEWDLADGRRPTRVLTGHTAAVRSLLLAPDGALLSASDDQTLLLWNPATGNPATGNPATAEPTLQLTGHTDRVVAASITADGRWAVSASDDRSLRVWRLSDGSTERVISVDGGFVACMALTPDGKRLITGSDDRLLRCWDWTAGELLAVWEGHTSGVRGLSVSGDGQQLFSADTGGSLAVRQLADGTATATVTATATATVTATFPAHPAPITCLALSEDGAHLLTGSQDRTLALWSRAQMEQPFSPGHTGPVNGLALTSDGRWLVSCGEDSALMLWDARSGRLLDRLPCGAVPLCVAALPTGAAVVVGDGAGQLLRYEFGENGFSRPAELLGEQRGAVLDIAVSPDGVYVAAATDTWAVALWELSTGKRSHILTGHRAPVLAVAFLPDGNGLLSADEAGAIRRWDISTGAGVALAAPFDSAVESLALAPDGRRLAVGLESGEIVCIALPEGAVVAEWEAHADWVAGLAFSADGRRLLSAGGDGTVRLWHLPEGSALDRRDAGVAFSRLALGEGGALALADEAGGVQVRDWAHDFTRFFASGSS